MSAIQEQIQPHLQLPEQQEQQQPSQVSQVSQEMAVQPKPVKEKKAKKQASEHAYPLEVKQILPFFVLWII